MSITMKTASTSLLVSRMTNSFRAAAVRNLSTEPFDTTKSTNAFPTTAISVPMSKPLWSSLVKAATGLEVRHLTTSNDILSAKKCLYKVYYEELGWNPNPSNPSGLRIVANNHFEDDIEDRADTGIGGVDWIGVFRHAKMVGVARIVHGIEMGLYLSEEENENLHRALNPTGKLRICEINRAAVVAEERGSAAFPLLSLSFLYFAGVREYDLALGTCHPELVRVHERYGFQRAGMIMKYSEDDPHGSEVGFFFTGLDGVLKHIVSFAAWKVSKFSRAICHQMSPRLQQQPERKKVAYNYGSTDTEDKA